MIFEPTRHVDDARLRELLAIAPGTNILSLEPEELAGRIVADPWVLRANVTRELPDGLRVVVEEHEPAAVLMAGHFYLVDRNGALFKRLAPSERGQLPIITGIGRESLLADTADAKQAIARALNIVDIYASKRRPRLGEVHLGAGGEVTLYTAELGTELRLGRGPAQTKLARYDALRAALGSDADKLAILHLDATVRPDRRERIVASFFPAQPLPTLLARADVPPGERGELPNTHDPVASYARDRPTRHRIPRYQ